MAIEPRKVGEFKSEVINALGLTIAVGTPIYIGETNIDHMVNKHPADFAKYGDDIDLILSEPDYAGINQKDSSIEFVKEFIVNNEYVKVAVRVSAAGRYFTRSMYILNSNRVRNFIAKGTLKKVDIH